MARVVTRFASPDAEVRGFLDAEIKVNNVATGDHFVANFEMTRSISSAVSRRRLGTD